MLIAVTFAIFALTIALILLKPFRLNEAWFAAFGGALMIASGRVSPGEAVEAANAGKEVLFFLFFLMLLSALIEEAGFFEWAALASAQLARGDTLRLFRNVFFLGAAVTIFLSLDTTAVILTPIVLAFVARLDLPRKPFLIACAFICNTASLLLPVSNLTNLLFTNAFSFSFARFVAFMTLPQLAVIAVNYWLFRFLFRDSLPATFDADLLPPAESAINDRPYYLTAVAVLILVLCGYFAGSFLGIPPYFVAGGGCLLLVLSGLARQRIRARWLMKQISWSLFPFVIGLFVVVRGVENIGLTEAGGRFVLAAGGSRFFQIMLTTVGAGLGSNVINNIPMALLSISIGQSSGLSFPALLGALAGCNLGPNLTVAGSLATMLVISSARKKGVLLEPLDFFKIGCVATPPLLVSAALTIWIQSLISG